MKDMDLKKKVLGEIIGMMKEKEVDGLKKKSPKFMAMSIEMKKPGEEKPELEIEKPEMEMEDEIDPEMLKKLLEQFGMKD